MYAAMVDVLPLNIVMIFLTANMMMNMEMMMIMDMVMMVVATKTLSN